MKPQTPPPRYCCEAQAELQRRIRAEAHALATLRDRGFKLSPAQAAKADRTLA